MSLSFFFLSISIFIFFFHPSYTRKALFEVCSRDNCTVKRLANSSKKNTQKEMGEPAWKRLGLKVKSVLGNDPLAIVTHREDGEVKEKKDKKDTKDKKRKLADQKEAEGEDAGKSKSKKPAKRVKLPKKERLQKRKESEEERDQLQYLKQFDEDREHWKFSKQKQNWIIKNIRHIPENYEGVLIKYLESIKGGSRDRIVEEMKSVVEKWNKMVDEAEEQLKKDLDNAEEKEKSGDDDDDGNKTQEEDKEEKTKKDKSKKNKPKKKAVLEKETPPDYDYAVRAREVHRALSGEKLLLKSIDSEEDQHENQERPIEVEVVEENINVDDHVDNDDSADSSD